MKPRAILYLTLPSLAQLMLFYSLAAHMYVSLGGWPAAIGERGFPWPLLIHARFACYYYALLFVFSFFLWPPAFLVTLAIPAVRRFLPYTTLYAVSSLSVYLLMQLAPAPYLRWWWD